MTHIQATERRPPSRWREMGSFAWVLAKVAACVVPLAGIGLLAAQWWGLNVGLGIFYAALIVGVIGYVGNQNYRWKLKDEAHRLEQEERDREREERDGVFESQRIGRGATNNDR